MVRVHWMCPAAELRGSYFRLLGLLKVVFRGRRFGYDDAPKRSVRCEVRRFSLEFCANGLVRLV